VQPASDPRVLDVSDPAAHQAIVSSFEQRRTTPPPKATTGYVDEYEESPEDSPNYDGTLEPVGGGSEPEPVDEDRDANRGRVRGQSQSVRHAARLAREVFGLDDDA
jgi:hypothetical protein